MCVKEGRVDSLPRVIEGVAREVKSGKGRAKATAKRVNEKNQGRSMKRVNRNEMHKCGFMNQRVKKTATGKCNRRSVEGVIEDKGFNRIRSSGTKWNGTGLDWKWNEAKLLSVL